MLNIGLTRTARALGVALVLCGGDGHADPPHARTAAEAAARTFRDWRLDCGAAGCTARASLAAGDGSEVLALTARRRADRPTLTITTPLPLFLPDGMLLGLGGATLIPVDWRTCDAAGCTAGTPLEPALLDALRRERAAEVSLTLVDGVRIRLAVSLRGFTAAWNALEARGPAASAPVTPP